MNLIEDRWIPCKRASGKKEKISPVDILDSFTSDPFVALDFPRADLNGSVTQFLIGLLQTTSTLDSEDWEDWLLDPPSQKSSRKGF